MNYWIATAAGLMGITVIAHIFGGGPDIIDVVIAADLPNSVRMLSLVVWHMVSLILVAFTGGLLYLAWHRNRALEILMSVSQVGFASLFLGLGVFELGNLTEMPQWTVFLLIPVLTTIGTMRRGQ